MSGFNSETCLIHGHYLRFWGASAGCPHCLGAIAVAPEVHSAEDSTFEEAASTKCEKCGAAYEAVRPGKIQPTCSCEYIQRLHEENDGHAETIRALRARLSAAEAERDKYRNGLISARGLVDSLWNGRVGGMFAYDVIDDALGDGEDRGGDDLRTALAEVAGVIESFHAREPHLKLAYALSVARAALGEGKG